MYISVFPKQVHERSEKFFIGNFQEILTPAFNFQLMLQIAQPPPPVIFLYVHEPPAGNIQ